MLRLGGNTSDYGFWKPTRNLGRSAACQARVQDRRPDADLSYAVTPEAVRNLRGFLDATGWTCLYGINLGTEHAELCG